MKLTEMGLINYIMDIELPYSFTVQDVCDKMKKHSINFWYRNTRIRDILKHMETEGYLMSRIGSVKKADGSITKNYYIKIDWK
jgi:hypothetical protein